MQTDGRFAATADRKEFDGQRAPTAQTAPRGRPWCACHGSGIDCPALAHVVAVVHVRHVRVHLALGTPCVEQPVNRGMHQATSVLTSIAATLGADPQCWPEMGEGRVPPPDDVNLGPLTRTVLDGAVWREESKYPAFQVWADEAERLFAFLEAQGVFQQFLPRLRAREREKTAALAEARAGFFLHRNGFRILCWEPEVVPHHPGDLDVQWQESEPIFVEVKGPDWEGELTEEERRAGRKDLPKYINAEGRAVVPQERVLYAISKALRKLAEPRANLVVVVDDLFLSPVELPKEHLTAVVANGLADPACRFVGGVFLLNPVSYGDFVEYRKYFVSNVGAVHPLPDVVRAGLAAGNADPQGPRRLRE